MNNVFNPDLGRDLTEQMVATELVYQGALLTVRRDQVRLPDGGLAGREYIVHPGAVAIIAITNDDRIVLERQYRYPLKRHFIELPAGKIDQGETPLATGQRELLEETGYSATRWTFATTIYPLIAYSDERIEIFLAEDLTLEHQRLDEGEFLEVFDVPVATALQWVRDGRINDCKSVIGLLWLERLLAERRG